MNALKVLVEPRRQEILRLVWDDEMTAGDIADRFDITFGAVSQHLRRLRDAGMVEVRADGNRRYYRANATRLEPLRPLLEAMWHDTLEELAVAVEERGSDA